MSPSILPALLAVGVVTAQAANTASFNLNITSANGGADTLISWSYTGTPTLALPIDTSTTGIGFVTGFLSDPPAMTVTGSDVDAYTGATAQITGLSTGLVLTNTTTLVSYALSDFMLMQAGGNDYFLFSWPGAFEGTNMLSINVGEVAVLSGPTSGSFLAGVPFSSFNAGQWSADLDLFSNFTADTTIGGSPIPEPSTYGLVLGGLALVGAAMRRRKKA
jgi:hypothetical protein